MEKKHTSTTVQPAAGQKTRKNTVEQTLIDMNNFRDRFLGELTEGITCGILGAPNIMFELYDITTLVIASLEDALANRHAKDKIALLIVKRKLETLINSDNFKEFDDMGEIGVCMCVSSGVKRHIRVMREVIRELVGNLDNKENRKLLDEFGF